jgi:uncharacterized protein with GYD domain
MPTYITLVNYTQEGAANMDESPERLEQAKQVTESHGGEYKNFYLTQGQYDAVYVAEYPDAEAATQVAITVAGGGAIETETLRAFPEDEYRDLIEGLPG